MKKLAIITTHPIQYYAPVFRMLSERKRIQVNIFYTWEKGAESFDKGFGKKVAWDIPLVEGYTHEFVSNGGSNRKDFMGVKNAGLVSAIESWGADAVLVYGWNYRSHLRAIRHFHKKIPVLFRGDSTLLDEQPGIKRMLRRSLLSWIYSSVDKVLYVGTQNKAYFNKHGVSDSKLHFVPHAIDNSRFTQDEEKHQATAQQLLQHAGITDNAIRVLYVGKLQPKKNPALLVDVFMRPEFSNMRLLLVGDGEQKEMLVDKAKDFPNIHFLPFQNQSMMPAIYRMGDIYCLPSQGPGETWGLAVNEAMASGRPVLVSDKVGCAADLVKNDQNGYVFPSGNAASLQSALLQMNDRRKLQQMGERSKAIISEWTLEKQVEAIEKVISVI